MLSVKVWNVGVLVTLVPVYGHLPRTKMTAFVIVTSKGELYLLTFGPCYSTRILFFLRLCQSFILPALIWCASGGLFQLIAQIEELMGTKINICVCLAVCPRKFNCGALSSFQNKRRLWNLGTLTIIVLCGTFFVCLAPLIFRKTYHMIY